MTSRFYATDKQEEVKETLLKNNYKYFLLAGGSRSGKTAILCYMVVFRAFHTPSRHAILRFHFQDAKQSIGRDTLPKILRLMGISYTINRAEWFFTITCEDGTSTSEIWIGGLDDKDRVEKILGKEFSTIYLNEASQISYLAYTTALTRLAENAGLETKLFVDCNPPEKTHWLYQLFVKKIQPGTRMPVRHPERYGVMAMNPADNPHIPKDYLETLESLPERQRRRYLLGEWLDKRKGALFTLEQIESARVPKAPCYLPRAVVAVDVAVTSNEDSDETGIITAAMDEAGEFYILRDDSLKGTPREWAEKVAEAYETAELDGAVYESNQGGEMVEHTIKTVNPNIPCFAVHATRGKALRAEPVVALYEQGKVHHVRSFPELEEQMTEWAPGDPKSPDRIDALVWAVSYLMAYRDIASDILPSPTTARDHFAFPYPKLCVPPALRNLQSKR